MTMFPLAQSNTNLCTTSFKRSDNKRPNYIASKTSSFQIVVRGKITKPKQQSIERMYRAYVAILIFVALNNSLKRKNFTMAVYTCAVTDCTSSSWKTDKISEVGVLSQVRRFWEENCGKPNALVFHCSCKNRLIKNYIFVSDRKQYKS